MTNEDIILGKLRQQKDEIDLNSEQLEKIALKALSFYIDDVLKAETNAMSIIVPQAMTIKEIIAVVDVAPTGASLIVDINKNGTTLYTTQVNRPTIVTSGTSVVATLPDMVTLATGDKITLDIDQIGSTIAGENLSVLVVCEVI